MTPENFFEGKTLFVQIIYLGPKMALIRGSIVLHRLIKGNVKNLQVSNSGPLWPSCCYLCFMSGMLSYLFLAALYCWNRADLVYSNCTPGAKNGPAPGTNVIHRLI